MQQRVSLTNTTLYPLTLGSHKTMMIVNIDKASQSSRSHLPDIVNDCERRQAIVHSTSADQTRLTCKEIAHSLRLVADQVDKKYCQDTNFNRNLHHLSVRLFWQSVFCTLWTRTLLPYFLLFCKAKSFIC